MNTWKGVIGLIVAINKSDQLRQNIMANEFRPGNLGLEKKIDPVTYQQAKIKSQQGPVVNFLILKTKVDQGSENKKYQII